MATIIAPNSEIAVKCRASTTGYTYAELRRAENGVRFSSQIRIESSMEG